MAVSSVLELPLVVATQAEKEITINEAVQGLASAVAGGYALVTTAATVAGTDLTLAYDNSNDLSARDALRFIYLELLPGATADFEVIHPAALHFFVCTNNTTQSATIRTAAGTGAVLGPGISALLYCDSVDVFSIPLAATISFSYDMDFTYIGSPGASEVIGKLMVGRDVNIPADFAGTRLRAETNPTADTIFTVRDDGVTIGTITVASGGGVTMATTGNVAVDVAAGSFLDIVAPASPDATIAGLYINIQAVTT